MRTLKAFVNMMEIINNISVGVGMVLNDGLEIRCGLLLESGELGFLCSALRS